MKINEFLDTLGNGGDDSDHNFSRKPHSPRKPQSNPIKESVVAEDIEDYDMSTVHPSDHGSKEEYDGEGAYVRNEIHTMLRVLSHLEHAIGEDENLPTWVIDKLSEAKEMIVSTMDYIISTKEIELDQSHGKEGHMMAEGSADKLDQGVAVTRYVIKCKETGRYWNSKSERFFSELHGGYTTYKSEAIALRVARRLANAKDNFRTLVVVAAPTYTQGAAGGGVADDAVVNKAFDRIEEMVESFAREYNIDAELIWEEFEQVSDRELMEAAAWQTRKGKNKNGGLNKKGVASYRRQHPGSKLQTAVTTKPSKLKKGSKAAKRRKSFCARMKGMKKKNTSSKTARDPNSRINKSLRKWNC